MYTLSVWISNVPKYFLLISYFLNNHVFHSSYYFCQELFIVFSYRQCRDTWKNDLGGFGNKMFKYVCFVHRQTQFNW